MKDENKALLNKTVEHAQLTKFQKFSGKNVNLNYSSKYISFSGSSSNIRRILFFHNSLGTMLLKLIYWNKSIQRVNFIITTKWLPGTTPENNREIPKKTNIWRKCDWVNITLWHECFPESCLSIVTSYRLTLTDFVLKFKLKNVHEWKSTKWILYPNTYLTECCLLHSAVDFFHFFQQVWWWFLMKWVINMFLH